MEEVEVFNVWSKLKKHYERLNHSYSFLNDNLKENVKLRERLVQRGLDDKIPAIDSEIERLKLKIMNIYPNMMTAYNELVDYVDAHPRYDIHY